MERRHAVLAGVLALMMVCGTALAEDGSTTAPAEAPAASNPEGSDEECETCGPECTGECGGDEDGPGGDDAASAAPRRMTAPEVDVALQAAGGGGNGGSTPAQQGPAPGSLEMARQSVSQMSPGQWRNLSEGTRNHFLGLGFRPSWLPAPEPPVDHLAHQRARETLTGGATYAPAPAPAPPRDLTLGPSAQEVAARARRRAEEQAWENYMLSQGFRQHGAPTTPNPYAFNRENVGNYVGIIPWVGPYAHAANTATTVDSALRGDVGGTAANASGFIPGIGYFTSNAGNAVNFMRYLDQAGRQGTWYYRGAPHNAQIGARP